MRTIYYSIAIVAMIVLSNSCAEQEAPPSVDCIKFQDKLLQSGTIGKDNARCIVLCDFSSSMDSASVQSVKEEALNIFDGFYGKVTIEFFPVTDASRKPFFESAALAITDSTKVTKIQFHKLNKCITEQKEEKRKELADMLDRECRDRRKATFLIQSVGLAIDEITVLDRLQQKKNIIFILSDMLECGSSLFGTFDLEHPDFPSALKRLMAINSKEGLPAIDKNIEFRAGYFSEKALSSDDLFKFWNIVFTKFHYNRPVVPSRILITHP